MTIIFTYKLILKSSSVAMEVSIPESWNEIFSSLACCGVSADKLFKLSQSFDENGRISIHFEPKPGIEIRDRHTCRALFSGVLNSVRKSLSTSPCIVLDSAEFGEHHSRIVAWLFSEK